MKRFLPILFRHKKYLYGFLYGILLLVSLLRPAALLYQERTSLFSKTHYLELYTFLNKAYYSSQYVQKKNPGIMPDQAFESFAAGAFLKGVNPILITHDQPPLGRYILALSILLFDNASTAVGILFLFSCVGVFLISRLVLKNSFIALIPFVLFINEPLILNQLVVSPLLEPVQLPFIIFTLYFFIKGVTSKKYMKWFVLTSLMLGFVISIRFFALGSFLFFSMVAYFILQKKVERKFFKFLLTVPITLIVLFLAYTKTIQSGSSLVHIFGIQKYIYYYHKSQLVTPFTFWDLLLFNRWHTWWGANVISSDSMWSILWPIAMVFSIGFIIFGLLKKLKMSEEDKVVVLWIVSYCFLLSIGESSTRYFPPLLPFLYIMGTGFVVKLIFKFKRK